MSEFENSEETLEEWLGTFEHLHDLTSKQKKIYEEEEKKFHCAVCKKDGDESKLVICDGIN